MLEVILARQARAMSDGKKISKKKLSKEDIKLVVLLVATVGIAVGAPRLLYNYYNNVFMVFLGLWLAVLDFDLLMIQFMYFIEDGVRWSPNPKKRRYAVKAVKLIAAIAYIVVAIGIYEGGRILALYLIYLRAMTSGLTKLSAFMTSQEAILTVLLLILLPVPAYIVKRETKNVIWKMENVTSA